MASASEAALWRIEHSMSNACSQSSRLRPPPLRARGAMASASSARSSQGWVVGGKARAGEGDAQHVAVEIGVEADAGRIAGPRAKRGECVDDRRSGGLRAMADAVDDDIGGVAGWRAHYDDLEAVAEQDAVIVHRDGADGEETIAMGVEARGLRVDDDPPARRGFDGRLAKPAPQRLQAETHPG